MPHPQSLAAKVSLIRAQIAPKLEIPSIIAITSARLNDGAEHLSYLLGESFHRCGDATLLVDFSSEGDRLLRLGQRVGQNLPTEIQSHLLKRGDNGPDILRVYVAENGALPGHIVLKGLFTELAQHYQIIVTAVPVPMNFPHALFSLTHADAILIAARQSRSLCPEDIQLRGSLPIEEKCLGVVTLESALIDQDPKIHFGKTRPLLPTVKGEYPRTNSILEPLN